MFQVEQKKGKDTVKNNKAEEKKPGMNINPAEMLREQYKAMQRNLGNTQETTPAVQMREEEEEEN